MQRPEHSFDEGVLTATDQRGVEFRLGLERRHQVAIGECSFQFGERVADPANDGRIVQACAFTSGKSFENGASRVELFCLLETDGADDGTAMGNRVDQAVGLQQPKRLANGRAAHAGHLAKLAFDQALARLQFPGHDRFTQLLGDHRSDGRNVLDPERGLQFTAFVHCLPPWCRH